MLRFIVVRRTKDNYSGQECTEHETLDIAVPELEERLTGGGYGESGYDHTELVGVEILRVPAK